MEPHDPNAALVTLDDIHKARACVQRCPRIIRTPMMKNVQALYDVNQDMQLHLKLESLQYTGSFKSRGVVYQLSAIPEACGSQDRKLVTMSAGNYGKAFAYMTSDLGLCAKVVMPDTAPANRVAMIKECGLEVECVPTVQIQPTVDRDVAERGMVFFHPFDDMRLIAAYGSVGLEVLEEVAAPDVVLVPCGGGGLLSGVAAAIKLTCRTPCRVYGVEPETACTMYQSFRSGAPAAMDAHSVAAGLSPPYAGANCYRHCRQHVEDILLVSDAHITAAVRHMYARRVLVEPSGAAGFAALLHGRVPDVRGKSVVVLVTGGNVSPEQLAQLSN